LLTRDVALDLIRESIDDINGERDSTSAIPFSNDLALHGIGSPLDSLDLVNFTVGLEERLRNHLGSSPDLAAAFVEEGARFRSVSALADYLASQQSA
jgi:hypothetical protein